MNIYIEKEDKFLFVKKLLTFMLFTFVIGSWAAGIALKASQAKADNVKAESADFSEAIVSMGNTAVPVSNPFEPMNIKKIKVMVTAYSSTVWQTDDTPFITASGEWVRDGIVANNMLPFGTRLTIPEIYGDKTFTVEDRMNPRKGDYNVDIWFPDNTQAKNFGARITYAEVLED